MSINRIINFLSSIYTLIFTYFYTNIIQKMNKKNKIVFVYFPVKINQKSLLKFIQKLKREKNIFVFLGYNQNTANQIRHEKNAFFINLGYIKFLQNINLFISTYLVYEYPKKSTRIYINHDIYDAPMVNKNNEKDIFESFKNLDYIFLSSKISIQNFRNKINFYLNKDYHKNLTLENTGYLKLDDVIDKLKRIKNNNKSILFAPTSGIMLKKFNSKKYIRLIISTILNKSKLNLIYRPHPLDINTDNKKKYILNILDKYIKNKRFFFDDKSSYIKSYADSALMITDFSGTAYTYAFSTLKPVLFYSLSEKDLIKTHYIKLNYFNDRKKIGIINTVNKDLLKNILLIKNKNLFYKKKIIKLRKERIIYLNKSIQRSIYLIKKILYNE